MNFNFHVSVNLAEHLNAFMTSVQLFSLIIFYTLVKIALKNKSGINEAGVRDSLKKSILISAWRLHKVAACYLQRFAYIQKASECLSRLLKH